MRTESRVALGVVVAAGLLLGAGVGAEPTAPLVTARALALRMGSGGRGEAVVRYQLADPLGGAPRAVRGRVVVESPDRVRLDFQTTGERITLRSDGGEWLQPAAHQMVRIPGERAAAALAWWRVLLPESRTGFSEDSLGPRRFRLTPRDPDAGPLHVVVTLDGRGLPAQVAVEGLEETPTAYRFSNWSFGPARGAAAFHIEPPAGFDVVNLP